MPIMPEAMTIWLTSFVRCPAPDAVGEFVDLAQGGVAEAAKGHATRCPHPGQPFPDTRRLVVPAGDEQVQQAHGEFPLVAV